MAEGVVVFFVTLESLHSPPLLARIVEMLGMGSLQTIDVRPFTKWWQGDSFHPEDVAKIGNLHALVSIILFQGRTGNSMPSDKRIVLPDCLRHSLPIAIIGN